MNWGILLSGISILTAIASVAIATVIPAESKHVSSLDGTWRFKIGQSSGEYGKLKRLSHQLPPALPEKMEPFNKLDYEEGRDWSDIEVPGNWEICGHSVATYDAPNNASGFYRKWFTDPPLGRAGWSS